LNEQKQETKLNLNICIFFYGRGVSETVPKTDLFKESLIQSLVCGFSGGKSENAKILFFAIITIIFTISDGFVTREQHRVITTICLCQKASSFLYRSENMYLLKTDSALN
jgi:hypothetical protein